MIILNIQITTSLMKKTSLKSKVITLIDIPLELTKLFPIDLKHIDESNVIIQEYKTLDGSAIATL